METRCFYIDIANWAAGGDWFRNLRLMQKLGGPTNRHPTFLFGYSRASAIPTRCGRTLT